MQLKGIIKLRSAELRRKWFEAQGFSIENNCAVSRCRNKVWYFEGDLCAIRYA